MCGDINIYIYIAYAKEDKRESRRLFLFLKPVSLFPALFPFSLEIKAKTKLASNNSSFPKWFFYSVLLSFSGFQRPK